ncbi:MAG: hypothetical protein WA188_16745 [Terriglobales bacterium]
MTEVENDDGYACAPAELARESDTLGASDLRISVIAVNTNLSAVAASASALF